MKKAKLGDLEVGRIGLGAMGMSAFYTGAGDDDDESTRTIHRAIELGVTLIDTAEMYGPFTNEELVGNALQGHRDEVVLATKFGIYDHDTGERGINSHPDNIRRAVEGSLKRLRTDRIDLLQYHQPDGVTPIAETLEALNELVEEGIVGEIGCSNFAAELLEEADRVARERGFARFVSLQNEYSLLERGIEADVQPACERLDVAILPYFPLASGLLTGKYRRGEDAPEGTRLHGRDSVGTDAQFDVVEAIGDYAEARGVGTIDVAISGLAAQPQVASVIAGATKPEQIEANVAALRWEPSADDLAELDRIAPTPR